MIGFAVCRIFASIVEFVNIEFLRYVFWNRRNYRESPQPRKGRQ